MLLVLFILVLAALLVAWTAGWLPLDALPADLGGVPTPMLLFVGLSVVVIVLLASSGRSRRL